MNFLRKLGICTFITLAPNVNAQQIVGYADLHSHMTSQKGFGGTLLHGDNYSEKGIAHAQDLASIFMVKMESMI